MHSLAGDRIKMSALPSDCVQSRPRLLLSALAILLVCLHTCQSVVFLGSIPGDLADARLGNTILEHDYQAILGYADLYSPSQFYPTANTLSYTDNYFGTAVVYAVFRQIGASMERAFQWWLIAVVAIDAAAVLWLLRRFAVNQWLAMPLVFFATSSSALVAKCVHPQVLPFFPFIFALGYFIQFLRTADARALALTILWWAYQNACYLYDGYFSILIFFALAVTWWALGPHDCFWSRFGQSFKEHWESVVVFALVALTVVAFIYIPYIIFSAQFGSRPIKELMLLAPNPGAWLSASKQSVFYLYQQFYKAGAYVVENTLFVGWVAVVGLATSIVAGLRSQRGSNLRIAAVISIASLLLIVFVTTWQGESGNAYIWLAAHVSGLRAFRSSARIGYLLFVLEAAAIAIFLNHLLGKAKARWQHLAVYVFALLIAVEQLSIGQPHYSPSTAQLRTAGLVEEWRKAGDHQVMIFAPGSTNQTIEALNLDCWPAALTLHRYCVNGYSGNQPAGYGTFLQNPTVDNAKALLGELGLDEKGVSVITDWPVAVKQRLGIQILAFKAAIVPVTTIKELSLQPGEVIEVPISLHSDEAITLPCNTLRIYASYRIYDHDREVPNPPSLRTQVYEVRPGVSPPLKMKLRAPLTKGLYEARLSMVQEDVAWWADKGAAGSTISLLVR
jgi:hypothetical protein